MGRTVRAGREGMDVGHVRIFGCEKPVDIEPTRAAGGTILRISNVPRQLESLDIPLQGKVGVESQGL